jgi:hypothetical protein
MRMLVCCLDYHEAGVCCYLVIHIENLLYLVQMFHFHLWPIYWLSLRYSSLILQNETSIHKIYREIEKLCTSN